VRSRNKIAAVQKAKWKQGEKTGVLDRIAEGNIGKKTQ